MVVAFFAAALILPFSSEGAVRVDGVPGWLSGSVERSLNSVWNEISTAGGQARDGNSLGLLSVVAERILAGYAVLSVSMDGADVTVRLKPREKVPWDVEIVPPQLASPVSEWFSGNAEGLEEKIGTMLAPLPLDALSWADVALKEGIEAICHPSLPGWNPSLLVRVQGQQRILRVSFAPRTPLVLAIVPSISSSTLPVMLRSDMRENILRALSPVVGLPIEWAAANRSRIEALAGESLLQTNTVSNVRGSVDVSFRSAQLAPLEAVVESPTYSLRAWVAAYAGAEGKYPEIGLHFGRNALPVTGWDLELYGEWILSADDFSLESRWGMTWSPWKRMHAGLELSFPGSVLWYRLSLEGGTGAPYVWWRHSEDGDDNAGVGWRVNGRISIELHYDSRDGDTLSLKALSDL